MKRYAFFLPQFHTTPENDKYWGENFTEWTNVKNAKPLYRNHVQPISPTEESGYYNLLDSNVFNNQVKNAKNKGFDGFIYWHYYFDKDLRTLDKVPELHRRSDQDFEFAFAWANTPWTKSWVGKENEIIFNQSYDLENIPNHAHYLKLFFSDIRHQKINNKSAFYVLNHNIQIEYYLRLLTEYLKTTYEIEIIVLFPDYVKNAKIEHLSFHYPPGVVMSRILSYKLFYSISKKIQPLIGPLRVSQQRYLKVLSKYLSKSNQSRQNIIPTILTGWDNTPRYQRRGFVLEGNRDVFIRAQENLWKSKIKSENNFTLYKSWNEWAEGNILEDFISSEN